MSKVNIFLFAIIILLLARGLFTMFSGEVVNYQDRFIALAETAGLIMMLVNGTFFGSRLFQTALFCLLASFLGAAFKIMHLNGGDEIILLSDLVLFIVYFIHFLRKKQKTRLDFLKVITLASMLIVAPVVLLHLTSMEQLQIFIAGSHILFWITFTDFIYSSRKQLLRN